jgi:hypothetical protein
MADPNYPLLSAIATGIGTGIGWMGKQVFSLVANTIKRESDRGDRLETKLFETQALVYPVLEEANSAIREAISRERRGQVLGGDGAAKA